MQIYFTRWAELSVSSPSLANTDGFITEFYMICYNTFSAISFLREDTLLECNGLCWKEGQIVLQRAMSRVISPVLLLDAGSNSLYLHSFIALALHLLTGAVTTLEASALSSQGINQTSSSSVSCRHTNIITVITSPASHITPFHGPWPHVPVISWTLEHWRYKIT